MNLGKAQGRKPLGQGLVLEGFGRLAIEADGHALAFGMGQQQFDDAIDGVSLHGRLALGADEPRCSGIEELEMVGEFGHRADRGA